MTQSIFVSYSRCDSDFGHRLHTLLEDTQYDVWIDWQDIPLTAKWWAEICAGIEASDSFAIIISPDSIASPICNLEIEHARKYNKRIVPILYRSTDERLAFADLATKSLNEYTRSLIAGRDILAIARDNWQALASINWVDFVDSEDDFPAYFRQLQSAIDIHIEHTHQHTRILIRAREWEHHKHDRGRLLTGNEIDEAELWLAQSGNRQPHPTTLHGDFILASREAESKRQQRLLIIASVAFAIVLILAFLSFGLYRQSDSRLAESQQRGTQVARERDFSESLRLAVDASAILQSEDGNVETAALLAIRALTTSYSPQADAALVEALDRLQIYIILPDGVDDIVFSPDNQHILF